jgi:hypothetical protein
METLTTCNVSDIPDGEREAIEQLLGQPLSGDQSVFIMAFTAGMTADPASRAAARARLEDQFQSQARRAHSEGITSDEADAAIEEAMHHVRPRPE